MSEHKGLVLGCSYCRTPLEETQMFEFRDWVGCETCIRDYYRSSVPEEIEHQLQIRRRNAMTWIARNRKSLEKQSIRKAV